MKKSNLKIFAVGLLTTIAFTSCVVRQDRPRRPRHPRKVIVVRSDYRNHNYNNHY